MPDLYKDVIEQSYPAVAIFGGLGVTAYAQVQ